MEENIKWSALFKALRIVFNNSNKHDHNIITSVFIRGNQEDQNQRWR